MSLICKYPKEICLWMQTIVCLKDAQSLVPVMIPSAGSAKIVWVKKALQTLKLLILSTQISTLVKDSFHRVFQYSTYYLSSKTTTFSPI